MAHGLNGYRSKGCRCATCTTAHRDHQREYLRLRRGYYDEPVAKVCPRCLVDFMPSNGKQRFCSRACQLAALRPAPMGSRQVQARRVIAKAARGTSSTWVWISGTCSECGEGFTRHGEASSFCSKTCSTRSKNRTRRALMRGLKVSRVRRFQIHERDDWTCHICGDPVNRDAVVPELDAPTLDHVIALAAGGSHSEDNLKTAHFYCNSVKRELPLSAVA